MGSERGDEYKRPCSLGEGTGSKEPDNSAAPQWATASRLVPTHQQDHYAAITIAGLELAHRIHKRQLSFGIGRPRREWSLKVLWDRRSLELVGRRDEIPIASRDRRCARTPLVA